MISLAYKLATLTAYSTVNYVSCANRIIIEIPKVRNVWQRCLPVLPATVNSDVLTELLPVASWQPLLPFLASLLEILAC